MLSLSPIYYNLSLIRADARMANEPCAFTMGPNRLASRIIIQIQGRAQVVLYQNNLMSYQLSQNVTTYFPVISLYSTCQDVSYYCRNVWRTPENGKRLLSVGHLIFGRLSYVTALVHVHFMWFTKYCSEPIRNTKQFLVNVMESDRYYQLNFTLNVLIYSGLIDNETSTSEAMLANKS